MRTGHLRKVKKVATQRRDFWPESPVLYTVGLVFSAEHYVASHCQLFLK